MREYLYDAICAYEVKEVLTVPDVIECLEGIEFHVSLHPQTSLSLNRQEKKP